MASILTNSNTEGPNLTRYGTDRLKSPIDQVQIAAVHTKATDRLQIHPTFHVSNVKPATDKSFTGLKKVVIPTDSSTDGIYEVEKILDHSYDGRTKKYSYYIKWKGYNELFHSTWEPESSFSGTARRILQEYKKSHALDSSPEGGGSANKRPRKAD
jgi:hypothetical protein